MTRVFLLVVLCSMIGFPLHAQNPNTRSGFWLDFGWGYGSIGCSSCSERMNGFSGGITLGGTVSSRVLLGIGTTKWMKTVDGVYYESSTIDLRSRFYPSAPGAFFVTAGLGLGILSSAFATDHQEGLGAGLVGGLGYDYRIGKNVSFTPIVMGVLVSAGGETSNRVHLGFAITVH
jgi:hypothetical protein